MKKHYFIIAIFMGLSVQHSRAETVDVKYRGIVDLKPFACSEISQSSFIRRVCYDRANQYMLIKLNQTYYHYCELPPTILEQFMAASSMGQYYNQNIKGWGGDGPFDCRTHRVPSY
jgi:hypothetical protein